MQNVFLSYFKSYRFDFFNYAGIHRPVILYTTPALRIEDIWTSTAYIKSDYSAATLSYNISVSKSKKVKRFVRNNKIHSCKKARSPGDFQLNIFIVDKSGRRVGTSDTLQGEITIDNPYLWWPVGMNQTIGYLYTLEVRLSICFRHKRMNSLEDVYRQRIGILIKML